MKNCHCRTNYEILGVSANASPYEIRRAYQDIYELYANDSLASYSFFRDEERRELLTELEQAYLILINEGSRRNYDQMLIAQGLLNEEMCYHDRGREPVPLYTFTRESFPRGKKLTFPAVSDNVVADKTAVIETDSTSTDEKIHVAPTIKAAVNPANIIDLRQKESTSGRDLQACRLQAGIELEEVSAQSKIKLSTLKAIEDDRYDLLPPLAYLKGFLKIYAQIIHCDPEVVIKGYIKNMQVVQGDPR